MTIILGTLAGIGPLCTDLYLPALPAMSRELRAGSSLVQMTLTASLLGLALGQLAIGPYSDIHGRRKPLVASMIVFTISSFLCAIAQSAEELIAFRLIQGVAGAGGLVISRAVARDLYSGPELTNFFSFLMLINGALPILSPVIGAQLIKYTQWSGIFIFLGAISFLITIGTFFGVKETLRESKRLSGGLSKTFAVYKKLLTSRRFAGFVLIQGFVMGGFFGYISGSPFVLQNVYGISAQAFSLCFAVNGIGMIIGAQIAGKLALRCGNDALLKTGLWFSLAVNAMLFASLAMKASLIPALILFFLSVSSTSITTTTSFALAIQDQEKAAGSASALLGLATFLFGAVAAPIVGIGGGDSALPTGAAIFGAAVFALVSYFGLVKKSGPSPAI